MLSSFKKLRDLCRIIEWNDYKAEFSKYRVKQIQEANENYQNGVTADADKWNRRDELSDLVDYDEDREKNALPNCWSHIRDVL